MPAQPGSSANLPRPDQPVFVIGDVHGRLDLLERILEKIDAVIGAREMSDPMLVFVGDLVDRGPASAGVLARVHELTTEFPDNVACLLGNHEQMMLDFLEAPVARQARWLRSGGVETCESFGLTVPQDPGLVDHAENLARDLRAALGEDLVHWMHRLPLQVRSGTLYLVHAAVDPGRPLEDQSARVLVWGHPEFLKHARSDGFWIAHGHTVLDDPVCADGRISVDTGAWKTGCLTSAVILPSGEVDFLQTV
ncbi:MAG: serine/threonine protein phosphatase [Paracoccaceae bacterium]